MRRLLFYAITAIILAYTTAGCRQEKTATEAETEEPELPRLGFFADSLDVEDGTVNTGETFLGLLTRIGAESGIARELADGCADVFDVRKMRAGNHWHAYYSRPDHKLQFVVYDNDKIHQTVFRCFEPAKAWNAEKEVTKELRFADVTIHSSLWNDMMDAGASPLVILKLADIYAWTVDFFGLQAEDRFRMVYNQTLCEDEIISVDTVFYATFTREGKDIESIMYDQGDGDNIYWDANGGSMRRAFLKAPLSFSRISSGFSYHRKHPISGKVKPHTAVDYAAPIGTPVMSIGDGTVLSVGWAGGGGNTVKISHNGVYTTSYMHLSRYASGLKAGQHVKQGQVIGYVGSTGSSTGPHLDFRVYKNGTPINPLKMESPSEDPIKPENKPGLDSARLVFMHLADSLEKIAHAPVPAPQDSLMSESPRRSRHHHQKQ